MALRLARRIITRHHCPGRHPSPPQSLPPMPITVIHTAAPHAPDMMTITTVTPISPLLPPLLVVSLVLLLSMMSHLARGDRISVGSSPGVISHGAQVGTHDMYYSMSR